MRINSGAVQLWRGRHMLDDLEGMKRSFLRWESA